LHLEVLGATELVGAMEVAAPTTFFQMVEAEDREARAASAALVAEGRAAGCISRAETSACRTTASAPIPLWVETAGLQARVVEVVPVVLEVPEAAVRLAITVVVDKMAGTAETAAAAVPVVTVEMEPSGTTAAREAGRRVALCTSPARLCV